MTDWRCGRVHLDLDVVPETIQAVHQLALRKVGEVAAHHPRYLRLRDAHAPAGLFLGQPETTHGASDLDHQAGLDLELLSIKQAEIAEDVARACFVFDA